MNTSTGSTITNLLLITTMKKALSPRPLYLNFGLYGDGDAEFKEELTFLMIGNIQELRQDFHQAVSLQNPDIFRKACHKAKVPLHMLDDTEFTALTEELKSRMSSDATGNSFADLIALFDALCDAIVHSLELEAAKSRQ
jgi:hypothetical protein